VHSLVRRYIKTALAFLAVGLGLGLYLMVRREATGAWPNPYLSTAHAHAILVGFLMFMILGVALWLFPRARADDRRYRPERIAAAYWMLLLGTVARVSGETLKPSLGFARLGWVAALGGTLQALGLVITSGPCGPGSAR
jgi:heme/copper-type cytochrome/quinol oxidase subunit 1